MKEYSMFDIVGPNMIGPSSSHTAGACRIGKTAYKMAKEDVKKVTFTLHGSFAKTYRGHGTDKALVGGILGFDPDDERLRDSFELAKDKNIEIIFLEEDLGEVHPNTAKVEIEKSNGETIEITASSIGGGNIVVTAINGLEIEFTGEYYTLIVSHEDKPGTIAKVTAVLALYDINIAFMRVYRYSKGQNAFMIIETDDEIREEIVAYIRKSIPEVPQAYLVNIN